jgi:peptidoglycan/LPS O-acetylase OafA/YrhL
MSTPARTVSPAIRRPRLPALTGVRIFAALHIYLFHLKQAHDAGVLTFPVLDRLPAPMANLVGRGYVSTGFFFQLSGFLLAYAYLDQSGQLKTSAREFWKGRFLRLYPLYFLSLLLLVPAPALLSFTATHPAPLELAAGVTASLTLTQAWFPSLALWWNAPAWAISAFATFYLILPAFARATAGLGRRGLIVLVTVLAASSWLPAGVYLAIDPYGDAWTVSAITLGGPWLAALRFNPLTWLPQFLSGVALGRLFAWQVDLGLVTPGPQGRPGPSAGDAVALGILLFLTLVPGVPYVPLRHGLLASLTLFVIADLARGRGLLGWLLAWRGFGRLSEASFSLFALQMPAGVWFCVALLRSPHGTTAQLLGLIAWTLLLAVLWAEAVQRPLIERLRHRGRTWRGHHAQAKPHVLDAAEPGAPDALNRRG